MHTAILTPLRRRISISSAIDEARLDNLARNHTRAMPLKEYEQSKIEYGLGDQKIRITPDLQESGETTQRPGEAGSLGD